ncbi:MAG: RHS repeat domain-containing protein, partial [Bacteroidales bacterium]
KISNNPEIILSQNVYNELGQAKQKKLHGSGSGFVQTEDFQYTIRGWLEKINDVHKPGNDLFAMGLNYTNGIVPQFNGNISAIDWVSSKFPEPNSYSYTYDQLNRLLTSTFAASGNFNESLTYDNNGNIATLVRAGQTATGVFGPVDDLAYIYTGNQLNNVNDNAGTAYQNNGFSDNGSNATNEYLYDPNGNLIKDLNKQIENITYTQHNLPQRIDMVTAGQPQILYLYDATGRKLLKQTRLDHDEVSRTDYDGSFVYKSGVLDYVLTPEGRAVYKGGIYNYEYNLKDHLGNTRVVFDQKGTVLQDNSYYPFGMTIEGLAFTSTEQNTPNKYLYNGKELQDDFYLDWYDYGARFYDPVLGRWHSVDPLAEKYNSISPFAYCALNPIKFVDKDGCEIWLSYVHKVDGQTVNVQYKNGALFNADGSKYEGKNSFFTRTAIQLNQLQYVGEETKNIITTLEQSDNLHTITNIDPAYPDAEGNHNRSVNILDDGIIKGITESENTVTKYDPEATKNVNGEKRNPKVGLIHELKHAFDRDQGTLRRGKTENGIKNSEVDAVNIENLTRKKTGDPKRTTYGRKQIPKEELK